MKVPQPSEKQRVFKLCFFYFLTLYKNGHSLFFSLGVSSCIVFFSRDKEHTKDDLAKAEREHWKVVEAMEAFMKVHKIER